MPSISAISFGPALVSLIISAGDACASALAMRWTTTARTSQRVQSVGSVHCSGVTSARTSPSRSFSTSVIAIASSCLMGGMVLAWITVPLITAIPWGW
jgi:hypothetical protein